MKKSSSQPDTDNKQNNENSELKQPAALPKEKNRLGFWDFIFSAFLCILLSVFLIILATMIFVHGLSGGTALPALGPISGAQITSFFEARYFLIPCCILIFIPMLILIIVNAHRIRRIFPAFGCSSIIAAIIGIVMVIFRNEIVKNFSGEWQDTLVNSTSVFKELFIIFALILIAVGATFLSIYSCIAVTKGGKQKNEKGN